jgi:GTP-binding protein LepA
MTHQKYIRNFCVIAHIDHGKSTLADRLLEMTGTVAKREMVEQILDSNPIERERGITIKLAPVRMQYKEYVLNLIDTPGHVDFGYEVSRSLAACEGAILVVDATQGVQAQTLANLHQARSHNLTIIPVINKIDMPTARIEETRGELRDLEFRDEDIIEISAKTGKNVEKVLDAIVKRIPSPCGSPSTSLRGLVFNSHYDTHKGVVVFVRIVDGSISYDADLHIQFVRSKANVIPIEIGVFSPKMKKVDTISAGEVGYIATGLKDVRLAKVGDTITISNKQIVPLSGYKEPKSMVFVGLFPISSSEFQHAREAMEKLRLSDSAFTFRPISSAALGNGFHCGFLGLLHAEIVQERLSREFGLNMIATSPSVEYRLRLTSGKSVSIQSASEYPDPTLIASAEEPVMKVSIIAPKQFVGPIMQLSQEKRGVFVDLSYSSSQSFLSYLIPLSEMIVDFFDRLKGITEGYASLDYEFEKYASVDAVKVDILLNHEKVDALSFLCVRSQARARGKHIVERLVEVLPRQQFTVPVQAAIGGEIVAREDIKSFRKDVTQKLYGGDRTRKDKLLEAQKKGKARMKLIGKVEIPQTAFFDVLRKR